MNQKERMLAGLPYKAWLDGLEEERIECRKKNHNRDYKKRLSQHLIL